MTTNLLQPIIRNPLNSVVESESVVLDALNVSQVLVTSGNGTVLVNGVDSGVSASVPANAGFAIKCTASGLYSTATHVVFTVNGVAHSFTAVTVDDPQLYVYPPQVGILPNDLTDAHDGSDFFDNGSNNKLAIYSNAGALISRKACEVTGQNTTGDGSSGVTYVPMPRQDHLLRIDALTKEILGSVRVGDRPHQVAALGSGVGTKHLATISTENLIAVINNDGTGVQYVAVPFEPLGITTNADVAYVACRGAKKISTLTPVEQAWVRVDHNTPGLSPFHVAHDGQYLWATCPSQNTLMRMGSSGEITTYPLLGTPCSIVYDGLSSLYVTLASSKAVVRVSTSTGAVAHTYAVETMPYSLALRPDRSLLVGCFGRSKIYNIDTGTNTVTEFATGGRYPYQLVTLGNDLLSFELYPQTPDYLYIHDSLVNAVRLTDMFRVRTAQNVLTNTIHVRGLSDGVSVPASVPHMYNAVLVKNNQNVGTSTTVVNGDTLMVDLTVPVVLNCPIEIPLFVGNVYDYFLSYVPLPDPLIFPISFDHVVDAQTNTIYTSNVVTISDIDQGTSVSLNMSSNDSALLIKNGNELPGTYSTTVTNGDTICLKLLSSANMGIGVTCVISIGAYSTCWTIVTEDTERRWLASHYSGYEMYQIPLPEQAGNAYRIGNSLQKINKATYTVGPEFSLHNSPIVADPSPSEFNYVVAYYENLIYKVSPSGSVAAVSTFDATAVPRADGTYAPKFRGKRLLSRHRMVSVSNYHIREVDASGADVPLFVGTDWTECTAKSLDGQHVYVGTSQRYIDVYKYDAVTRLYGIDNRIDCRSALCAIEAGFREIVVAGDGTLWVLDVVNNIVIHVDAAHSTVLSTTTLGPRVTAWSIVASNSAIWLANSYDNSVLKLDASTGSPIAIVRVGSVPAALEVDATTDSVWVGYYASNKIDVIDAATNRITQTISTSAPVTSILADSAGNMWALHMYVDLYLDSTLSDSTAVAPALAEIVGAAPATRALSASVSLQGLPRPIRVSVSDVNNTRLYINGDQVGVINAVMDNGQTLVVGTDSPAEFAATSKVVLTGFNSPALWSVTTSPDVIPNYVYFESVSDVRTRYVGHSTTVTISGLSEGTSVTLSVLANPQMTIIVNDVAFVGAAPAVNGDVVQLVYDTAGWYYGRSVMFELQYGIPGEATTFGTFDVTTLSLLGAVRNAVRDVLTYEFVAYEKEGFRTNVETAARATATKIQHRHNETSAAPGPAVPVRLHAEFETPISTTKSPIRLPNTLTDVAAAPKAGQRVQHANVLAETVVATSVPGSPSLFAELPQPLTVARTKHTAELIIASALPLHISKTIHTSGQASWARSSSRPVNVIPVEGVFEKAIVSPAVALSVAASEYSRSITHVGFEIGTGFERGARSSPRTTYSLSERNAVSPQLTHAAYYERNVSHDSHEVNAEYGRHLFGEQPTCEAHYERNASYTSPVVVGKFERDVRSASLIAEAYYERGVHHHRSVHTVGTMWERNVEQASKSVGTAYERGAVAPSIRSSPARWERAPRAEHYSAQQKYINARPGTSLAIDVSRWEKQTTCLIDVPRDAYAVWPSYNKAVPVLQPLTVSFDAGNLMRSGTLEDQHVFRTPEEAIAAAVALGFPIENVSTWQFQTTTNEPGSSIEIPTVAWMWKIKPEITSRDCGAGAGAPKYPVPYKWYVQGG